MHPHPDLAICTEELEDRTYYINDVVLLIGIFTKGLTGLHLSQS